jgi:hypothetical protein
MVFPDSAGHSGISFGRISPLFDLIGTILFRVFRIIGV